MKISLKTEFWNEESVDTWKERYSKLLYIFSIFGIAITIIGHKYPVMWVTGLWLLIIGLLGTLTKNKWEQKNGKARKQEED